MKIYVWCALTHATDEFKNEINEFKNKIKSEYELLDFLWVILWTEVDVYNHDTKCVKECDLFIAECSYPSIWLWYELWLANTLWKPILAIAKEDVKVTRMVLWINTPNYEFIRYKKISDLIPKIQEKINKLNNYK